MRFFSPMRTRVSREHVLTLWLVAAGLAQISTPFTGVLGFAFSGVLLLVAAGVYRWMRPLDQIYNVGGRQRILAAHEVVERLPVVLVGASGEVLWASQAGKDLLGQVTHLPPEADQTKLPYATVLVRRQPWHDGTQLVHLSRVDGLVDSQQELSRSNRDLEQLMAGIEAPYAVVDDYGRLVHVSERMTELLGTQLADRELDRIRCRVDDASLKDLLGVSCRNVSAYIGSPGVTGMHLQVSVEPAHVLGVDASIVTLIDETSARRDALRMGVFLKSMLASLAEPAADVLMRWGDDPRFEKLLDRCRAIVAVARDHEVLETFDHGHFVPKLETCDFADLAKSAVGTMKDRFGVRFDLAKDLGDLRVVGDRKHLLRAAAELMRGAARRTPPGGTVRVEVKREGHSAALHVWDQSLSAKRSPQFIRYSAPTGEPDLSLSVAREIAEHHRGKVSYEHRNGRGRFSLRMPRVVLA
jgi:signal transduction histidine kinase